jgi:hypothetical protein
MEGQPQEKMIHELSGEELKAAIETGRQRLDNLLTEVELYSEEEKRENSKQLAYEQFEALVTLYEELGKEKRVKIAAIHAQDDSSMDAGRFQGDGAEMIPTYIRKENE